MISSGRPSIEAVSNTTYRRSRRISTRKTYTGTTPISESNSWTKTPVCVDENRRTDSISANSLTTPVSNMNPVSTEEKPKRQSVSRNRGRPRVKNSHARDRLTASNNILPPCRVCGGSASGFHYGVNTCEACKRFFRRAMDRKRLLKCRGGKSCCQKNILLCAFCRHKRCLAVGMSKSAIKTGRYSHEQRTDNLQQVQKHEQNQLSFFLTTAEVDDTREMLFEAFGHMMTNVDVPEEEIDRALREKVESVRLGSEIFGRPHTLTEEQYEEVFNATGLDVDGRRQHGAFMATSVEYFIMRFVKFAKHIPPFTRLCLPDQTALLKECWIHVWFLAAHKGFRTDLSAFYPPNKKCRTRAELQRTLGSEWADHCFALADRMQAVRMVKEDVVFLCVISLLTADVCELEERGRVEEAQWFFLKCLLHLLRRRHGVRTQAVFGRICSCLVQLRTVSNVIRRSLTSGQLSDIIQSHPVLMDVL